MLASLKDLLPENVSPGDIWAAVDKSAWAQNRLLALIQALRTCGKLDWDAYLDHNPDVREAGIDPVMHFIRHGLGEGRKLYGARSDHPLVSVIVSNYNNELYLEKCLTSLVGQTLKAIEIIVVDDGSLDSSKDIIAAFAKSDSRIKPLYFEHNQSLFMTRKEGAAIARGDYVMFLDSDDYYAPHACETAYNAMGDGIQICAFNVNIINHNVFKNSPGWYNTLPAGQYIGHEKIDLPYLQEKMPHFMCGKIFERALIQDAFASLEPGRINMYEDIYSFLLPASSSRAIAKIDDKLLNYSFGSGMTTGGAVRIDHKTILRHSDALPAFQRLCERTGHNDAFLNMKRSFLRWSFEAMEQVGADNANAYFDGLVCRFGALYTVLNMIRIFWARPQDLAAAFAFYQNRKNLNTLSRDAGGIGLLVWKTDDVLLNNYIISIISVLKAQGRDVAVFAEAPALFDMPGVRTCRLHKHGGEDDAPHLKSLWQSMQNADIQTVLVMGINEIQFFWDSILLRLLGKHVLGFYLGDAAQEISARSPAFGRTKWLSMLACLDKIIFSDWEAQMLFSACGIKNGAILKPYLGNLDQGAAATDHHKLVFLLPCHEKCPEMNVNFILKAFLHFIRINPEAMLVFAISNNQKLDQKILNMAASLGLSDHVSLIGRNIMDADYLATVDYLVDIGQNLAPFHIGDFGRPVLSLEHVITAPGRNYDDILINAMREREEIGRPHAESGANDAPVSAPRHFIAQLLALIDSPDSFSGDKAENTAIMPGVIKNISSLF